MRGGSASLCKRSRAVTFWDWVLPAALGCEEHAPLCVFAIGPEEITAEAVEEETAGRITRRMLEEWDVETTYDSEAEKVMEEQFAYQYPYGASRHQKMKFTVSELKKRAYLAEVLGMKPGRRAKSYMRSRMWCPFCPSS